MYGMRITRAPPPSVARPFEDKNHTYIYARPCFDTSTYRSIYTGYTPGVLHKQRVYPFCTMHVARRYTCVRSEIEITWRYL